MNAQTRSAIEVALVYLISHQHDLVSSYTLQDEDGAPRVFPDAVEAEHLAEVETAITGLEAALEGEPA